VYGSIFERPTLAEEESNTPVAAIPPAAPERRDVAPLLVGVALFLLATWRARYGVSLFDSSHYTVVAMRLAQGSRPFVDEMTLQATAFLPGAIFAKVWLLAFGREAIELALRVSFVVAAAGAGLVIFRALRPSFGPWPSLVAAAVPLLAPPLNILALSYNTGALAAFMVATALSLAALRDEDRFAAAGAGVAFAYGVVSYPPFVAGAVVGIASFAFVARSRRLTLWMLGGGLSLATVVLGWLLVVGSLGGLRDTFAYAAASSGGVLQAPLDRLLRFLPFVIEPLTRPNAWPAWILALAALVPLRPPWLRAAAMGLIPLAVTVPALRHVSPGQEYIGVIGAAMLITMSGIVFLPLAGWMIARPNRDMRVLLWLTGPLALVDTVLVLQSTNAGWYRGTGFTGFAPLAMALLVAWALFIRENGGRAVFAASTASLLLAALLLLFATTFKDEVPFRLRTPVTTGAYAGLLTTQERARDFATIEALGRRWVRPEDSLVVMHAPGVYMLMPGRIETNATWLSTGPSDRFALDYFARRKGMPRVVVVHASTPTGTVSLANDPLLKAVTTQYRLAGGTTQFDIYLRR
jgi:4-amino-4-deoxy-L-arabinose transferase-like glycosyltransferase